MVGKSIAEQMRELKAKQESASLGCGQPLVRAQEVADSDFASPLRAKQIAKLSVGSGLISNALPVPSAPPHEPRGADPERVPPTPPHEPRDADPKWVSSVKHRQMLMRRGLSYGGSSTPSTTSARRTNHCFKCVPKVTVDNLLHQVCPTCTQLNIICPQCGSCGCYYAPLLTESDVQLADLVESWISDNVASWTVAQNGKYVFPHAVAGVPVVSKSEWSRQRAKQHEEYLDSKTWRALRLRALQDACYQCDVCGSDSDLQVHHKTYIRWGGAELPKDLQVMCRNCHFNHHDSFELARTYLDFEQQAKAPTRRRAKTTWQRE